MINTGYIKRPFGLEVPDRSKLRLARVRRNDVGLVADDDVNKARRRFSGKDLPNIFQAGCVDNEDDVETAWSTLKLPALGARQGMNAQDPFSISITIWCVRISCYLPV